MANAYTPSEAAQLIRDIESLSRDAHGILDLQARCRSETREIVRQTIASGVLSQWAENDLRFGRVDGMIPPGAERMIAALGKNIRINALAERCRETVRLYDGEISRAKRDLAPSLGLLGRLFMGRQRRQAADAAYGILLAFKHGPYGTKIQDAISRTQSTGILSGSAAQADYMQHQSLYREVFDDCAQGLGRGSIAEVDQLAEQCKSLMSRCKDAPTLVRKCEDEVRQAAKAYVSDRAMEQMKHVPVEELTKLRGGIRVKPLQDNGYTTVADVYGTYEFALSCIRGISSDGAAAIRSAAEQYAISIESDIGIRLSYDRQSLLASSLVAALYRVREVSGRVERLQVMLLADESALRKGLQNIQVIGSCDNWIFSEGDSREQMLDAYKSLSYLAHGELAHAVQDVYAFSAREPDDLRYMACESFRAHSIEYNNLLEAIVPGALGKSDALYGLPEQLVREIEDQCFFPDGLTCELRRYQEWGVKYILHQERVLLGDEMGLGKTVQAIAAMVSLRNTGEDHFMVVCPASVLSNWCKEIEAKSKLHAVRVHGSSRESAFRQWIAHGGVAVTTYETTQGLSLGEDGKLDMLIVDEAHYIKNPEAHRSQSVRNLAKSANRLLFMTGTALENKVEEMISLIQVLRPGIAMDIRSLAFLTTARQFRECVAPVYYRRKREDVLTELPELIENEEWCTLTREEEARYEDSILAKQFARARRVSWDMENLSNSCKAIRMKEIVDEAISDGRKIIVFSFFLETIRKIQAFLGPICMSPIQGSVAPDRRQQILDEFFLPTSPSVLPAQIQSGGTGLNIQAASVVILCEPQLKPSIESQAISRAFRMGQPRDVLVYRLLCENTVDERIYEILKEKQAQFDAFADKSVSAEQTAKQEAELDEQSIRNIIQSEIDRINIKRGNVGDQSEGEHIA